MRLLEMLVTVEVVDEVGMPREMSIARVNLSFEEKLVQM